MCRHVGLTLVIRLGQPDAALLSKLALPFFQATSTRLPLNREVSGPYPSAGRYAFTRNDVNVLTSIRRNQYWTQGSRGHLDGVDIHWNQDANTVVDDVDAGRLDEVAGIAASRRQALADRYGVNTGRFQVRPTTCTNSIALNPSNPLFHNNAPLRRALNYAVDRTDYLAPLGPYAGTPWSHLLTPGVPGALPAQPYPAHAALVTAARLARGHLRPREDHGLLPLVGDDRPGARRGGAPGSARHGLPGGQRDDEGPLRRQHLHGDGHPSDRLGPQRLGRLVQQHTLRVRPPRSGRARRCSCAQQRHVPPAVRRRTAPSRLEAALALGRLDLEITRNLAPTVMMGAADVQFLFSARVDLRSLAYEPSVGNRSFASLALK